MTESIVGETDALYCWHGPKMGMTILTAKLGKLILTEQRLLFLSAGASGGGQRMAGAAGLPTFGGSTVAVSLDKKGSVEIPLAAISRCEAGKKRALVVWHRTDAGSEDAHAFGQQLGMPNLDAWVTAIDARRGVQPA